MSVYNADRFVGEAIDSIFNQGYSNLHLLIAYNYSTDNSFVVIEQYQKKFPNKITILSSPTESIGVVKAYELLLENSTADYVFVADADDVWVQGKIHASFRAMYMLEKKYGEENPLLVSTDMSVVDQNLDVIVPSFIQKGKATPRHLANFRRVLSQNTTSGPTCLLNRALIDALIPFPIELEVYVDRWIGLVALSLGHAYVIEKPYLLYRQHDRNTIGVHFPDGMERLKKIMSLSKHVNKFRFEMNRSRQYARMLYSHYKEDLSEEKQLVLEKFITLPEMNFIAKRWSMIRFGLFHVSPWRSFLQFVFV